MAYEAVPAAMRTCPQWIAWRYEFVPDKNKWTKVPVSPVTGRNAATDRPSDWTTFENAVAYATQYNLGLGFVFGYASGLSGLDLDGVLDQHGAVLIHKYVQIADAFNSYTELSPSGTGLHVIFAAEIEKGRRFEGVEIYGRGRFFTVTGVPFGSPRDVAARQDIANQLLADIDARRKAAMPADLDLNAVATKSDYDVWSLAMGARNGALATRLWNGDTSYHHNNHSEADFALIDILAHYTNSPMQVYNLFMQSGLGQRDKAKQRPKYVMDMIQRAWDNKPQLVAIPPMPEQPQQQQPAQQPQAAAHAHLDIEDLEAAAERRDDPYRLPPGGGLVADVAQYIYQQSPYPIKEAALSAALVMIAGIVGRQYQVSKTGCNLYIMLLANTGSGKEAMTAGVSKLMDSVIRPRLAPGQVPTTADTGFSAARDFRGPAILTGKGVLKALASTSSLSFFSIFNEFASELEKMKDKPGNNNAGYADLRRMILDLYMKSTAGVNFEGSVTADKETSVKSIASPAFSFLAESTPGKLYKYLDDDMVTSGLLPRMLIIETNHLNEHYNAHHSSVEVPAHVTAQLAALCKLVFDYRNTSDLRQHVQLTPDAEQISEEYRAHCRSRMRDGNDITNELWNRCHLNALRIAAVVAVGQNMTAPVITADVFHWAARMITRQTILLAQKFKQGEIGQQETSERQQFDVLRNIVQDYKAKAPEELPRIYVPDARRAGMIGWNYMQRRTSQKAAFYSDKRGALTALRNTIEALRKAGELGDPAKLQGHGGEFYMLT